MISRKCSDCKIEKPLSCFAKDRNRPLGHTYTCKDCFLIRTRDRADRLRAEIYKNEIKIGDNEKLCRMCNTVKPKTQFNKNKARSNGVFSMCAECRRARATYPKSSELTILYTGLDDEKWVDVDMKDGEVYPYRISNCGRIFLLRTEKYANPSFDQKGYPQIVLTSNNKKRVGRRIHILVGMHFVDNSNGLKEINHKDGNKLNPHYTNLEWNTSKQNKKHAIENGLWKPFDSYTSPRSKMVVDLNTGQVYPSAVYVERLFGVSGLHNKLRGWRKNNTSFQYYNQ